MTTVAIYKYEIMLIRGISRYAYHDTEGLGFQEIHWDKDSLAR